MGSTGVTSILATPISRARPPACAQSHPAITSRTRKDDRSGWFITVDRLRELPATAVTLSRAPLPLERSAAVSKTSRRAWEVRRRRELAACCGWSTTTQPRSVGYGQDRESL